MQSTSIFPITLFVMLFRMGISLDYIFSNENLADVLTKGLTPRDMSFESSIYISVALDSLCYRLCHQLIISSKPPKNATPLHSPFHYFSTSPLLLTLTMSSGVSDTVRSALTFPFRFIKSIPFLIRSWNVPRIKRTKTRVVGMLE